MEKNTKEIMETRLSGNTIHLLTCLLCNSQRHIFQNKEIHLTVALVSDKPRADDGWRIRIRILPSICALTITVDGSHSWSIMYIVTLKFTMYVRSLCYDQYDGFHSGATNV